MGDDGTYFQTVKLRGYRVTANSSVTVEVNGESKTFKHGAGVTFPTSAGGKQTLTFNTVDFAGYGVTALNASVPYNDFSGRDLKGKLVVWLPGTPAVLTAGGGRAGGRGSRSPYIVQTLGAGAALTFVPAPAPPTPADLALTRAQEALAAANVALAEAQVLARGGRAGGRGAIGGGRGAAAPTTADITTVQRVDGLVAPQFSANEEFFTFLFNAAPTKFADLRARADKGEALAPFTLSNVKVTVHVDNTYEVVSTQLSKNVVGLVEGSDPKLKDTYVMFGSHLDHVGYRPAAAAGRGGRAGGGAGASAAPGEPDLIFNGADDDGSGSTGLLGIAKAFATGPRPKRSAIFVWHTGEESGLLGSRYMADFPVVPLDKVQAQFNIDMIGRNRDDNPAEENKVYVIGADRISTDLHNLVVQSSQALPKPVTLDFEYNDPNDANSFYTRSDHYSYAAKGIPIAFFFTGTHPDYHGAGDHVDKILFPKLVRIAQVIYQAGFAVANSERTLERDNKGPRSGKGFEGVIKK